MNEFRKKIVDLAKVKKGKYIKGWIMKNLDGEEFAIWDGLKKVNIRINRNIVTKNLNELKEGNFILAELDLDNTIKKEEQLALLLEDSSGIDIMNMNDEELLRYRYLDIRYTKLKNLKIKSKLIQKSIEFFSKEGFDYIETPFLTSSINEYTMDEFKVYSPLYEGEYYTLSQSPQVYKQLLMTSGVDKYIQLARSFRAERGDDTHLQEFTQLDSEIACHSKEEIMDLLEKYICFVFKETAGIELKRPFPRYEYLKIVEEFDTDDPGEVVSTDGFFEKKGHQDNSEFRPCWITRFPYAIKRGEKLVTSHHVMSKPEEIEKIYDDDVDLTKLTCESYDLMLQGVEIGGGDIRIENADDQLRLLKLMGYSEEIIQEKFSPLLKGLSCATPPHGGFAIGIDRIAMLLCKDNRINSVTAFPKTPDCRDLLTNGPKKENKIGEGR